MRIETKFNRNPLLNQFPEGVCIRYLKWSALSQKQTQPHPQIGIGVMLCNNKCVFTEIGNKEDTCSAMADGGEAVVVVVFGTEAEDDLRLLLCSLLLLGTLSISWDNDEDETGVRVDLVLADSTGVILAGESLEFIPAELLTIRTSIIM